MKVELPIDPCNGPLQQERCSIFYSLIVKSETALRVRRRLIEVIIDESVHVLVERKRTQVQEIVAKHSVVAS